MTTEGGGDEGDDLSAATREAATRARHRAREEVPTPDDLAGMTVGTAGAELARAEMRRLAAEAIGNVRKIEFLLGRLTELVDEERSP